MKISRALILSSLIIAAAPILSSCSGDNFATPFTDQTKLTHEVKPNEKFTEPSDGNSALGEVTISEVVDGDTFHFINGREDPKTSHEVHYTVRFEGVNTPESTARIEPWGVKASQFVKSILWDASAEKQKPYSVVLQNDISVFGQFDNTSAKRYMGFVWYKMTEKDDYRLLNLEIIEQCYSKCLLNNYSAFCPYLDAFTEAAKKSAASKKRVFGEKDPGFDYTNTILDASIHYILDNYENLGVSSTDSESASESGVNVRITGAIVGFSGDSTFIRDVTDPYLDGSYASIYVYTALTVTAMAKTYRVGQIISFVGKATMYHNNVQITDVKNVSTGTKDEKITVVISPKDFGITRNSDWQDETLVATYVNECAKLGYTLNLMPTDNIETFNKISSTDDLAKYMGHYVKVKLTIRAGDNEDPVPTLDEKTEDCYRLDSDGQSITYLAKTASGAKIAIRSVFYQQGYYGKDKVKPTVGADYYVIGQVAKHYKTYQVVVPNSNTASPAYGDSGYLYLA